MRTIQEIQRKIFFAIFLQGASFLAAAILAIIFYPGGTRFNPAAKFSIFTTFFSDLGRIVALNGELNTISRSFYITGLLCFSFAYAFLFSVLPFFFRHRKGLFALSVSTTIIAFILAVSTIVLAFTPVDVNSLRHNRLIYLIASVSAAVYIAYTFLGFSAHDVLPRRAVFLFLALVIYDVLFAIMMVIGVWLSSEAKVIIRAFGHTVAIFFQGISLTIIALLCHYKIKHISPVEVPSQLQPI
ncbi:MAG: hypothetical protein K9W42_04175 [Candidatus Heimdallarchaeota archaeon]|nr:hypothetical protein [Candidatus Heimdallarchaeota archaeon]